MNVKTGAFDTHFTYTDQERDDESGLMYYGARYYHPVLGRFTQPDPVIIDTGRREFQIALLNPQTLNPYSYVANNPLKLVDPTGEAGNQFGVVFDYASEGARAVSQLFHDSAKNWREQVNPLSTNTGSTAWGATSYTVAEGLDTVSGIFGNAQKVLDPETPSSQKAFAGAMLSLDLAGGGESQASKQALKEVLKHIDDGGKILNATLNTQQIENLKRFVNKAPANSILSIFDSNGNKTFQAISPSRNVPGSKAIYEKIVNKLGETLKYIKTTIDPKGAIVHIKDKITGAILKP